MWKVLRRAQTWAKAMCTIGLLFLMQVALAGDAQYGGTFPHTVLRVGDPASFEVVGPSAGAGAPVTGTPVRLVFANVGEGYQMITDNPLPSSWVGDYTLTTTTTDASGSTTTRTITITYAPSLIPVVTATSGDLAIPAVDYSFHSATRQNPITTAQWIMPDGSVMAGSQQIRVSAHKDSTVAVRVAGVVVNPGDVGVPIGTYDFSGAKGILSLPLSAVEKGKEGKARLWITTTAPNSPAVDLTVTAWTPHVALSSPAWTVTQAFDVAKVSLVAEPQNRCDLVVSIGLAQGGDALAKPKCLVEWDPLPIDLKLITGTVPKVEGRMWVNGSYTVGYKLSLVDTTNTKVAVGDGVKTLTVQPIGDLLSYAPRRDSDQAYRLVQPIRVYLDQSAGPSCDTYVSSASEYRSSDAVVRCSLTWTQVPDALAQDQWWQRPYLTGNLTTVGTQSVGWKVEVVSPLGARIPAGQGSFAYQVSDPPPPAISENMLEPVREGLYAVSRDGGYAGDVYVTGVNADFHVTVERGGTKVEDGDFEAWPSGGTRKIVRRIEGAEAPLWSQTPWQVHAWYSAMPSARADTSFAMLAVPSHDIKPVVQAADGVALDTADLKVSVSMRNVVKPDLPYDAATMGEWRVRLLRYSGTSKAEPITEFVDASGGEASFNIPGSDLGYGYVRITAEAALISPVPDYQRLVQSVRPLNITVVRGGEIAADVTARRVAGEAPFSVVFWATLDNRLDASALGDVVWHISSDGGGTWTNSTSDRWAKMRMVHTFAKGEYLVTATLKNRYSGAEYTTEPVHVIAFDVPKGKLDGPENVFIGATGHYSLNLTFRGNPLPDDQVVVEWSEDSGKSFASGGLTHDVTRATADRMTLVARARMVDAPADVREAWREIRRRLWFVPIRPPRVGLVGPALVEYPKSGQFRAYMSPPYRNMVVSLRGAWRTPDGAVVDGTMLTYQPTEADKAAEVVKLLYDAEVIGFGGTQSTTDKRVRVWEYVWPEFSLEVSRPTQYAPADLTARLRQQGAPMELDRPVYEWTLPAGVTLRDAQNDRVRVVNAPDSGTYAFQASVSDARGNKSVVKNTATLLAPPNYAMSLSYSQSNSFGREPLDVTIRPSITGGHPRDRVATLTYLVDDAVAAVSAGYAKVRLSAGKHTVEVQAKTEMGWTFSASQEIVVVPNKPPTCSLTMQEWTGGWLYSADCRDTDGRVVLYRWTLDGTDLGINSNRISVSRFGRDAAPAVTVSAVDDSDAESSSVGAATADPAPGGETTTGP